MWLKNMFKTLLSCNEVYEVAGMHDKRMAVGIGYAWQGGAA